MLKNCGHHFCDALYSPIFYDKALVDRNEYRAIKWAFKQLIDKEKLFELGRKGYRRHELAEEFGVTEELVEIAYNYYMQN